MARSSRLRIPVAGFAPKALALWGLLALQAFCALFFIADVFTDLLALEQTVGGVEHHSFELVVVLALAFSIVLTSVEIRRVLWRHKRLEGQLKAASGAFFQVLDEYFDNWSLTPSEREVALLAIKGLSVADIARVRNTKEGTVKAQCNAIYGKAGVTGRQQLLSLFIDELMDEGLMERRPELR